MKFNFKEILDFLKGQWEKFKAFWAKLSKKTKILVVAGGSLLLFLLIFFFIVSHFILYGKQRTGSRLYKYAVSGNFIFY